MARERGTERNKEQNHALPGSLCRLLLDTCLPASGHIFDDSPSTDFEI